VIFFKVEIVMIKDIANLHNLAADYLERAARLHREAADLYNQGEQDKAAQQAYSAYGNFHIASHYAKDAAKFYVQTVDNSENYVITKSMSLKHVMSAIS
jgi:hypothetical protein